MNADEIKARVDQMQAEIDSGSYDNEYLHLDEDGLLARALEAIANGAPHPSKIAQAALGAIKLDYQRWYA